MHVLSKEYTTQKFIARSVVALFFIICVLVGGYALLVNRTVMNVVAREKTEDEIASLTSHVGDLEFKEMSLRGTITMETAYALGFNEAPEITFIARSGDSKNLSLSRQ